MVEKYCKLIKKTIKALDNNDVCTREMRETAIQAMKEVQQYHKLGTIEQCNEATKRAKAKKTIHRNGQHANCARCGQEVYVLDCYCRVCGQKLDWSDEE